MHWENMMGDQDVVRVLIAEDDPTMGKMLKGMLQYLGYAVIGQATNGRSTVEMAYELHPDVIILDIQMPDMDGIDAAYQINELCPTPMVVLTAHENPALIQRSSAAGVGAYLVKPSNPREMERAIIIARSRFTDMLALAHINTELHTRNEELNAFAHAVAHGLQNTLSLILGYSDALLRYRTTMDRTDQGECVLSIMKNAHKMNNIITELLLLAEVRKTNVTVTRLEMKDVVDSVLLRLDDLIKERKAQVTLPAAWPAALGYAPWIEEVWVNYLSNAVAYGGNPPQVELGASPQPDKMVRFWVRDNGLGISPQEQTGLFTQFTQLNQVRLKGSGLGLSVVRRIVEKLKGQVGVESEEGKGSLFFFTLPEAAQSLEAS